MAKKAKMSLTIRTSGPNKGTKKRKRKEGEKKTIKD